MNRNVLFIILAVASGALVALNSQCGAPRKPTVNESFAQPIPDHLRFTAPCATCHEANRPAAKDNVAHGFGRECGECHEYVATAPWTPLFFSHNPSPTACLGCHASDRPARETHPQVVDCASCHAFPTWVPKF